MKKKYVSPSVRWEWIGMDKDLADIEVYGNYASKHNVKGQNVWDDEDGSATDEESDVSVVNTKSVWDEKW